MTTSVILYTYVYQLQLEYCNVPKATCSFQRLLGSKVYTVWFLPVFGIQNRIRIACGFSWDWGSGSELGSGSRKAKLNHKKEKSEDFMFWSAGFSLWGAGGFSCSLKALRRGLRITILLFFNHNIWILFSIIKFYNFSFFLTFIIPKGRTGPTFKYFYDTR